MSCVEVMNRVELNDIEVAYPELRRFDDLKVDGYVHRPNITAVCDSEKGLVFELPTPQKVPATIAMAWRKHPGQEKLLSMPKDERTDKLEKLFTESDREMQYPVLASEVNGNGFNLDMTPTLRFDYTDACLKQVARLCGLKNYDDLKWDAEHYPDTAAQQINNRFQDADVLNLNRKRPTHPCEVKHFARLFIADPQMLRESGSPWVLRTLLSDKYRTIDTTDVLSVLFNLLTEKQDAFPPGKIDLKASFNDESCWFTLTNKAIQKATKRGQVVCASMRGGTHELGGGSATVETRALVLTCTNGMTTGHKMSLRHLGGRNGKDVPEGMFSDRTKQAQQATLLLELRDAMEFAFDDLRFEQVIEKMERNQDETVKPEEAPAIFEAVRQKLNVADTVKDALFSQFMAERHPDGSANQSQDGVVQAITARGRDQATVDYSKAMPFEDVGGKIHNLERNKFQAFVKQAASDPRRAARML